MICDDEGRAQAFRDHLRCCSRCQRNLVEAMAQRPVHTSSDARAMVDAAYTRAMARARKLTALSTIPVSAAVLGAYALGAPAWLLSLVALATGWATVRVLILRDERRRP